MKPHGYNFTSGEELSYIGASWLVSYLYYLKIDQNHRNWDKVSDVATRKNRCKRHSQFHSVWLQEIIRMNPEKLDRNHIGLNGAEVIEMAKAVLPLLMNDSMVQVNSTASFHIHIAYQGNMKLKELADMLNTINLSVNDYYRDCGIGNRELSRHAAAVNKVANGSIWLEVLIAVFSGITSTLLAEYILHRMRNGKENCRVHIEAGDNNTIHIHIQNSKQ